MTLTRREFIRSSAGAAAALTAPTAGWPAHRTTRPPARVPPRDAGSHRLSPGGGEADDLLRLYHALRRHRMGPGRSGAAHRGQPEGPEQPGHHLQQGQRPHRGHRVLGASPPPPAPHRPARLRRLGAHLLGRGPRRGRDPHACPSRGGYSREVRLPLRARQDQGLQQALHECLRHAPSPEPPLDLQQQPPRAADELLRPRVRMGEPGPRAHEAGAQLRRQPHGGLSGRSVHAQAADGCPGGPRCAPRHLRGAPFGHGFGLGRVLSR